MSDTGQATVLDLADVEHSYRRTPALRGVTLQVAPGEVVAVTGPSGCGKSTLLHVAAGILRPQSGRVRLLGHDLAATGEAERSRLRRRRVGIVLQFGQLVPELTVCDNVALPLLLEGVAAPQAREVAAEMLRTVGLPNARAVLPGELSGGQAQQAAVARALVAGPELVLADEPTASTDSAAGERLLDLLLGGAEAAGSAVVLVTHDNVVAARAEREVRLRDGVVHSTSVLT